ncbi:MULTISPECIES: helix-turn-helix domain-containing protein [Bacillus cereus group]|uniref:HTH cro/C1-type domain-containing protein n=3 Tax=Bacillus cereus group TaxID=86661 RepID=A0A0J1HXP4_BACAN|nr:MULTISPECIES: helix-turn-helix transcriptional regulator [Bacillus cereus group]HDR4589542.1 helix-turn-helix transcriptional regulator [Bacillus cytotoxicus]HDR7766073.1 helix-turn-helix transcriptional regulator [Bacillus paranthracis]EOQ19802.1 hypothetical protein IKC_04276 [Bacillus cereus VD184]KLV18449.1 hypothetical protein ABW01_13845 [Bacillus anthracis]MBF8119045.1 helix-turn-helix transcriptional regulator [Bacillus cereus]
MEHKKIDWKEIKPIDDIERIILLKKRFNLSTREFARKIGVTPNYLSSVLTNSLPISDKLVKKVNAFVEKQNCIDE